MRQFFDAGGLNRQDFASQVTYTARHPSTTATAAHGVPLPQFEAWHGVIGRLSKDLRGHVPNKETQP